MSDNYSAGRSKSENYGVPTTAQTCDAGFMQGYRDAEASRRFQQTSMTMPTDILPTRRDFEPSLPAAPSEPLTLAGAVRGLAGTGIAIAVLYALFVLQASWAVIAGYAFGGLALGAVAGVAIWMAAKLLELAFWLLGWALKIGAVLAIGYFALHFLAR